MKLDTESTTARNSATSLPTSSVAFVATLDTWPATAPTVNVARTGATMDLLSVVDPLPDVSEEGTLWTANTMPSCKNCLGEVPLQTAHLNNASKVDLVATTKARATVAVKMSSHGNVDLLALLLRGRPVRLLATMVLVQPVRGLKEGAVVAAETTMAGVEEGTTLTDMIATEEEVEAAVVQHHGNKLPRLLHPEVVSSTATATEVEATTSTTKAEWLLHLEWVAMAILLKDTATLTALPHPRQ